MLLTAMVSWGGAIFIAVASTSSTAWLRDMTKRVRRAADGDLYDRDSS